MKKKKEKFIHAIVFLFALTLSSPSGLFAFQPDTLKIKKIKSPKHYFLPTFFSNVYAVPKREFNAKQSIGNQSVGDILKGYSYTQNNYGFYIPVFTKDKYNNDSSVISNWHILATGNFLISKPVFSGLANQHTFIKSGIGGRVMYNNGKKDVFFFDLAPFILKDKGAMEDKTQWRSSSTFVWCHLVNEKFSFRLGYTRSFILGNRFTLPYLGIRIGRLDKVYLSIQFPRDIFFNVPIIRSFSFNVIAKPVGNIFAYKDNDSIYPGTNKRLILGRKDIIFGGGFDFHPSKYFSLFLQAGVVSRQSSITLFSEAYNKGNNFNSLDNFYHQALPKSVFVNFGITVRLGKSKSYYGNRNIYELQNLNTEIDPGDNNQGTNSSEISPNGNLKRINKIKYKDLADLVDDSDLYD